MPAVTRSSDMLTLLNGLFFIDDDVIDMASKFYSELRCTIATFGEETIERLVPHISSMLNKLNDISKVNVELLNEMSDLRANLYAVERKYGSLNSSFRDKSN